MTPFAIFLWAYYGHPDHVVQRRAVMRFHNGNRHEYPFPEQQSK